MVSPTLYRAWIATRPPSVQKLAAEFPLMMKIPRALTCGLSDQQFFVVGYTEDDHLIISHLDPHRDYRKAYAHRQYLCAKHVRGKN